MENTTNNIIAFIKLLRSNEALELIAKRPSAFNLLTLIALRARRTNAEHFDKLKIGEAFIGDCESYGVTEQIYRTDKKFLEKHNLATFKPTTKGTIARLISTSIFDINEEKPTDGRSDRKRTINEQPTTNNNENNENNENLLKESLLIESVINDFNFNFKTKISTDDKRQINAIKQILSANYTPEDIINCAAWLLYENEFWSERGVDFIIVKNQIVKYFQVQNMKDIFQSPTGEE